MQGKAEHLRPLLYNKHMSTYNKTLIYKQIVLPTALYATPIWMYAAKTHLNKIETAQNKILRRIRGAHRYLTNEIVRKDLNTLKFTQYAKIRAEKFYDSLFDIPNDIIAEIPSYDHRDKNFARRPRASLLDR